jgi:two-component system chemotaxis response regulator CheB
VNVFGGDLVGILLTGMGRDGAEELRLMKDRGGITIVQNKESSVVYGMPWEAVKLNAATYELSPEMIAQALEILVDRNYINTNSTIENEILKKPS